MTENKPQLAFTHPDGSEIKFKTYRMTSTSSEQHFINKSNETFGRWKSATNSCCTKGVVYLILREASAGWVKFINNNGTVDEAHCVHFQLATKGEYAAQFAKLEEVEQPTKSAAPKPIQKKQTKKKK